MNKRQSFSLSHALHWGALEIAGVYLILGVLWILFSDQIAARVALNEEVLATISLYKGWAYVLITAGLLYALIRRHTARLRTGELQLQRLLDALPALISYVDKDQHYRFTNSAYQDWFGGETLGKHVREVVGESAYQAALKYIDKVLSGETVHYETEIVFPAGERFISAIYVPDIGVSGKVEGFFTLVHDITEKKQTLEELRLWADAFEGCAHGIAIGDPNTNRIVVCNPSFAQLHKGRVEDIVGSAILSLYAASDHEVVRRSIQRADQIGHARFEARMIRKDSSTFPVEMDVVSILDENGEVLHRVATAQDISERKQAEKVLKESKERYRIVSELTSDYAYKDRVERDGSIVPEWITDSFTRITGYTWQEAQTPELWGKLIYPDDVPALSEHTRRILSGEVHTQEMRITTKSGDIHWLRDFANPVYDSTQGRVVGLYGAVQDITEYKQAEEKLRLQARWLEQINDAVINSDQNFIITVWNPAAERVYGWKAEEVVGKKGEEVLRSEFFSKTRAEVIQELKETGEFSAEITQLRKDGSRIHIETRTVALRDENGHSMGYVSVNRDITERKQAEQENASLARFPAENPNPVMRATHEGTIIYANEASKPLLHDWHARVGDSLPEDWIQLIQEIIQTGSGKTIDIQCGEKTYSIMIVYAPDANDVNIYGRDITERKQAEEYLRRFELLSENSRDIILFIEYQDGRILEANAAAVQAYGYERDELLTLTVRDLRASNTRGLTADQMAQADAGGLLFETIHRRKDGTTFPVEVSSQGAAIGGARTLISIVRDITERKRAEEALQSSQEQLLSLIEQAPISIAMFDQEMRYIVTSQRWVAEYGRGYTSLIGRSHYEIHPDIPEQWKDAHRRGIAGESLRNDNDEWTQADGTRFWLRWAIVPWRNSQGEIGGIIISAEDITETRRAEEALRLKDDLLRLTSEMVKVGGWEFDAQTGLGTWTDEVARIHDLDPAQETNVETGLRFYVGESRVKVEQAVKEAVELAKPYDLELELVTQKGNHKWVRTMALPIVQDGKVLKVQGIFQDITERKNAEKALTESEARFRSLFEQSADANLLLENNIFTDCNDATIRMMRADSKEDILATHPAQLSPEYQPDGRLSSEKADDLIRIALENGSNSFEWIHRRMDDTDFPVEVLLTSISTGDRQVIHVVWRDITERKQIEQALQVAHDELELKVQERTAELSEANALLQALLDNLPDHIYFKDRQSRFIRNSRSQASLLGLSDPAEVVGRTDFDFFPHAARSFAEEQEVMNSGKPIVDLEEWVVWPDGRETWVLTTKLPLRNSEGQTIGIFGISHDITERKRAEQAIRQLNADLEKQAEQLQAANKELEAFSYSVSHDLRAPLRAIDGYTRILVEDYESVLDDEGKRVCSVISREARRMGQLIDDLLSFSRLGRKEMYSSKIEMRTLTVSVLNELLKEENRERFDIHIANLPVAKGDSSLIRQVWVNLLANAIKFTSKKERAVIEVGGKTTKDELIYYVRDNGAGFDMEYANKLFGVFQRLHSESEFTGTGVGLAIVQRIIRRHNGRVWAEGEVEKGATFYFALPRKEILS